MDIKGLPTQALVSHSYTPGKVEFAPGGVARNIAENLARLGVPVQLFGMIGQDAAGDQLSAATAAAGVGVQGLIRHPSLPTATDVSIFNEAGDLVQAVTAVETMSQLTPAHLMPLAAELFAAKLLIADTNVSFETLQYLLSGCNQRGIPMVIEPVSVPFAEKINQLQGGLFMLTPNELEARALSRSASHLLITRGKETVVWRTPERETHFSVPLVPEVKNTVGAGDAFLAGTIAAWYRGNEMDRAIAWGIAAAGITLQSTKAVSPDLSLSRLMQKLIP